MVTYLDAEPDMQILEPSCGTGALISALLENGQDKITAIERSIELAQLTSDRYSLPVHTGCFLEYAEQTTARFHRVIMNPPFKKVKLHMRAALSLLDTGGKLIALVPITYKDGDTILR